MRACAGQPLRGLEALVTPLPAHLGPSPPGAAILQAGIFGQAKAAKD